MNINQIEVKGITYQVEDTEARSGLAQAVVDIDTIKEELPKKAVFNDIPWADIISEITDINPSVELRNVFAMKRSGFIYVDIRGVWRGNAQTTGTNFFSVPEKWQPYKNMVNLNVGIGTAWYSSEPYLQFFRMYFTSNSTLSIGENTARNGGTIESLLTWPALHP